MQSSFCEFVPYNSIFSRSCTFNATVEGIPSLAGIDFLGLTSPDLCKVLCGGNVLLFTHAHVHLHGDRAMSDSSGLVVQGVRASA